MKKITAILAGLSAAGLMFAGTAFADEPISVSMTINTITIDAASDVCELNVDVTTVPNNQGPYTIDVLADGNLICTALEVKEVNAFEPFLAVLLLDPFDPFGAPITIQQITN